MNSKIAVGRFPFFNRGSDPSRQGGGEKNRLVPRAFEEVLRQRISTSRGDACQNRKSAGSRRDEERKKEDERKKEEKKKKKKKKMKRQRSETAETL